MKFLNGESAERAVVLGATVRVMVRSVRVAVLGGADADRALDEPSALDALLWAAARAPGAAFDCALAALSDAVFAGFALPAVLVAAFAAVFGAAFLAAGVLAAAFLAAGVLAAAFLAAGCLAAGCLALALGVGDCFTAAFLLAVVALAVGDFFTAGFLVASVALAAVVLALARDVPVDFVPDLADELAVDARLFPADAAMHGLCL